MHTPTPANVAESLKRLRRDADFQEVTKFLLAELEDAKAVLVDADDTKFSRLQGRARGVRDVLEFLEPALLKRPSKPHP